MEDPGPEFAELLEIERSRARRSGARRALAVFAGFALLFGAGLIARHVLIGSPGDDVSVSRVPQHSIALPNRFASYVQLSGLTARAREEYTSQDALLRPVQLAVFGASAGDPRFVALAYGADSKDALGEEILSGDPAGLLDQFFSGLDSSAATTSFPAGEFGGELSCARFSDAGDHFIACGWVDDSTFGAVLSLVQQRMDDVAALTRSLRAAAEHEI